MGYSVRPAGRLHLPETDDAAAVAAVKCAWSTQDRKPNLALFVPNDTLTDIATWAAVVIVRDGDWLEFAYDEAGDPKWSDLATAFFVEIAPYVHSGTVSFEGEDGSQWSYTYAAGRIEQHGLNGCDVTTEPFGDPVRCPE